MNELEILTLAYNLGTKGGMKDIPTFQQFQLACEYNRNLEDPKLINILCGERDKMEMRMAYPSGREMTIICWLLNSKRESLQRMPLIRMQIS